jgi:predicted aconitase
MAIELTKREQEMLDGKDGWATQKAMEIQLQMGEIYEAEKMVPIISVHMPGVSSTVTGEPACEFIEKMKDTGGKFKVLTTLNPCAVDMDSWKEIGFNQDTYDFQKRIVDAYVAMGGVPMMCCTPFFAGNTPRVGEHVAWGESSAVVYCNSVMGARTNREGGPGALAAALTGVVPAYGYHLNENRYGQIQVNVKCKLMTLAEYGAMGHAIGMKTGSKVPVITGIDKNVSTDNLRTFGASLATGGSTALFHVVGATPEAPSLEAAFGPKKPELVFDIGEEEMKAAADLLNVHNNEPYGVVVLGCPQMSLDEVEFVAKALKGKKIRSGVDMWVMLGHPVLATARRTGYADIIEKAGATLVIDTCPSLGHFSDPVKNKGYRSMVTNSAKLSHYIPGLWNVPTYFKSTDDCLKIVLDK